MVDETANITKSNKAILFYFLYLLLFSCFALSNLFFYQYIHIGEMFAIFIMVILPLALNPVSIYLYLNSKKYGISDFKRYFIFIFVVTGCFGFATIEILIIDFDFYWAAIFLLDLLLPIVITYCLKKYKDKENVSLKTYIIIAILVVVIPCVTAAPGILMFEYKMNNLFLFISFVMLFITIITLTSMNYNGMEKKKFRSVFIIYSFLVILVSTPTIGLLSAKRDIEKSERKAEPIIKALESYKAKQGEYPQNLEKLVPEYLKEIPINSIGFGEKYLYDGDSHDLYFHTMGWDNCYVRLGEAKPHWYCDD